MYIVCAPKQQVNEIITLLDKIAIKSYVLPLIDFVFDLEKLKYFEDNVNSFDYVMISSPSVIQATKEIIPQAINTKFITVGAKSAEEIRKYTENEIIYPEHSSGRKALLNEKLKILDFTEKKVLIIKGESNSKRDYSNITKLYPNRLELELYQRISLKINEAELKKLLDSGCVQGIIITTSSLVADLFALGTKICCSGLLQKELFIVLHPQIMKKLHEFGASKVLVTKSANKEEITALIMEYSAKNRIKLEI